MEKSERFSELLVIFLPDILTSPNGLDYLTKQIKNPRAQTKVCSVVDILQMVG